MSSLRLLLVQGLLLLILVQLGLTLVSDEEWAQYKAQYNKFYRFRDRYHRGLYDKRVQLVADHNRRYFQGLEGFEMRLNQFSDIDQKVYYSDRLLITPPTDEESGAVRKPSNYKRYDEITKGIDWREYGYISGVGTQGTECLSCWAFSSSGVIEAHLAKKNGKLVPLSPKHLLDCVPYPNQGCKLGGWVSVAFNYVRQFGTATKASFPYQPKKDECHWDPKNSAGTIRGHVTLTEGDEKELAEVVYNIGPVAVSIDHLHDEFVQYFGGILNISSCGSTKDDLTHSVLVVGFGTHPKWGDYWLIKNSFGTSWGESGYFKLARNANNMCGVATLPQYPLV
ncbi:procathepsin L-like [Drosophila eugracilis]|uniref:procathepsin L-like n=1 Tax=Drosophila eugracilis TaxID=29029 RepID=UPI0007E6954D|nr:procathepsin L-like [Drosophila eugracilis]